MVVRSEGTITVVDPFDWLAVVDPFDWLAVATPMTVLGVATTVCVPGQWSVAQTCRSCGDG